MPRLPRPTHGQGQIPLAPAWLADLSRQPLLQDLPPQDWQRVVAGVESLHLRAGETFLREEADTAGLFLLVAGEVAVRANGRLVTLTSAPHALGLLSLVDGRPRTASLEAFSDCHVLHLPRPVFAALQRESAAFASNLTRALAAELRRMYATETQWLTHVDDFFEAPNAKLVPGPYVADRVDMVILAMRGDPRVLGDLLPPGLRPIPGFADRYLLTFNFFTGVHSESPLAHGKVFAYSETCPFLPCLGPHLQPAVFTPELYPDNLLAIALGREAYGFPKRFGRTQEGDRRIDLNVGSQLTLRASWQRSEPVTAGQWAAHLAAVWTGGPDLPALLAPLLGRVVEAVDSERFSRLKPAVPVFVHKQIVDERTEAERILDVDSLIEIPFHISDLEDFQLLRGAEVQHFDPAYFLQGVCLGGVRLAMGFRFGRGHPWRDYKEPSSRAAAPWGRLWQRWRPR